MSSYSDYLKKRNDNKCKPGLLNAICDQNAKVPQNTDFCTPWLNGAEQPAGNVINYGNLACSNITGVCPPAGAASSLGYPYINSGGTPSAIGFTGATGFTGPTGPTGSPGPTGPGSLLIQYVSAVNLPPSNDLTQGVMASAKATACTASITPLANNSKIYINFKMAVINIF